jgi:hypothetical protein
MVQKLSQPKQSVSIYSKSIGDLSPSVFNYYFIPILSVMPLPCLPVILSVCLLVCLYFCHLSCAPIFRLESFLPVLSVAVQLTSMSACRLVCLSFFHAACLKQAYHLVCLSFCHAACLSVRHPVHPPNGLFLILPVCRPLPFFCYSPSYLP